MLDVKYFSQYQKNIGIKFSIEAIIKPPKGKITCIIYNLIQNYVIKNDQSEMIINSFSQINWEKSTKDIIVFNEGFINMNGVQFDESSYILIKAY